MTRRRNKQPANTKSIRRRSLNQKSIDSNREPGGLFTDELCRHCHWEFPTYEEECPSCLGLRSELPDIAVPPEMRLAVNAELDSALARLFDALLVTGVH